MTYVYTHDNIVLSEINRNHSAYTLFEKFLQRAFGPETRVVINHHIVYETRIDGRRNTQEIPSADTLIFSPYYMQRVFGNQAEPVMRALLMCQPRDREVHLAREIELLEAAELLKNRRSISRTPLALRGAQIIDVGPDPHPLVGEQIESLKDGKT